MNIALEKAEEWVAGQKKRSYGDAFVRGNNGEHHRPSAVTQDPRFHLLILISVMYIAASS